jgi:hypothetical protein
VWAADCHTNDKSAEHQNQEFTATATATAAATVTATADATTQLRNKWSGLCLGAGIGGIELQQLPCSALNQTTWSIQRASNSLRSDTSDIQHTKGETLSVWELMDGRGLCATA